MAETTQQQLADLIDAFNQAWVRPEKWAEGEFDEASVRLREIWARERDKWTVNLLGLIKTWLLYPEDGPDADSEEGLQSWSQNIATFKANMALGAETREMEILRAMDDYSGDDG
jgi:hypothetical protein